MHNSKEYLPKTGPRFPSPETVGPRLWGDEILLCLVEGKFMLKELRVKAGFKGGLQFHRKKDECGFLIEGEIIIRHESKKGNLIEKIIRPGDVFHCSPGGIHQEEAIADCRIIEESTTYFNDRVRLEEHFGLETCEGIPSTSKEKIIIYIIII